MPKRGRPKKVCPPFFPHFANASKESDTIAALEAETGADGKPLGNNGYAFWFKLLEMLRVADGMCIDCKVPANWKRIQARTRLTEDDVKICINVLCTMGAINADYWQNENIIWCDKFLEHLQEAGCKAADAVPPQVVESQPGKTVEETPFGTVVIDEGWQKVEAVYAEQIGELPMGEYMDALMHYYDQLGADVIEIAIRATNRRQPDNPKSYLLRVLDKWVSRGITTPEKAQASVTEFERKSQASSNEKRKMTEVIDRTKWV